MEVMLGHVDIRMAHNALNRGQIHSQCLHLAHIGMAAGMRRLHPNMGDLKSEDTAIVADYVQSLSNIPQYQKYDNPPPKPQAEPAEGVNNG